MPAFYQTRRGLRDAVLVRIYGAVRIRTYTAVETVVAEPIEGASIRETVLEMGGGDRVEISVSGRIDGARLVRSPKEKSGVLDVITLTGTVERGEVMLALLATDASGSVLAGPMVDARAVDVRIVLTRYSSGPSTPTSTTTTTTTGLTVARSSAASAAASVVGWKDVQAASAAHGEEPEEDYSIPPPRPGDTLEHASFGSCRVEKLEEDEDFILVRSPANRIMRLSLEVLRPELISEADGKRVFRARSGVKR
jgi:hypothetical protein